MVSPPRVKCQVQIRKICTAAGVYLQNAPQGTTITFCIDDTR
jgi:hypothetical protein